MKTGLGILAPSISILLLCIGFLGMMGSCMMSHSEPEFSSGLTKAGMMALLFGFLLCWAAWKLKRSEKE